MKDFALEHFLNEVPVGWHDLVRDTHKQIIKVDPEYRIRQIKEKFGGLRFYMSTTTPYIDGAISLAEAVSYTQCEYCGQSSNRGLPQKGWVKTFCDDCYKKYKV